MSTQILSSEICIFRICSTKYMKYQISSSLILLHTSTHERQSACSDTQPCESYMPGERSKAATNSSRFHFLRSRTEKNCWTLGWTCIPLIFIGTKKQNGMLKWKIIYNGWKKGYSFFEFYLFRGKGWGSCKEKNKFTKQSLWDDNTNNGVAVGAVECKKRMWEKSLHSPSERGEILIS